MQKAGLVDASGGVDVRLAPAAPLPCASTKRSVLHLAPPSETVACVSHASRLSQLQRKGLRKLVLGNGVCPRARGQWRDVHMGVGGIGEMGIGGSGVD